MHSKKCTLLFRSQSLTFCLCDLQFFIKQRYKQKSLIQCLPTQSVHICIYKNIFTYMHRHTTIASKVATNFWNWFIYLLNISVVILLEITQYPGCVLRKTLYQEIHVFFLMLFKRWLFYITVLITIENGVVAKPSNTVPITI